MSTPRQISLREIGQTVARNRRGIHFFELLCVPDCQAAISASDGDVASSWVEGDGDDRGVVGGQLMEEGATHKIADSEDTVGASADCPSPVGGEPNDLHETGARGLVNLQTRFLSCVPDSHVCVSARASDELAEGVVLDSGDRGAVGVGEGADGLLRVGVPETEATSVSAGDDTGDCLVGSEARNRGSEAF